MYPQFGKIEYFQFKAMFQHAVNIKFENNTVLVSSDSRALLYFLNKDKW